MAYWTHHYPDSFCDLRYVICDWTLHWQKMLHSTCALCLVMTGSLWPRGLEPTRLLCPWGFSRQEYWSGLPCPPQGIFPTQGLKPDIPHCRWNLYHLSHQGRARILEWIAHPFSRGSSQPRDWTEVSTIAGRFFTDWATREAYIALAMVLSLILQFSSVQLLSCVWLFATHGPQHAKPRCPSSTPRIYSNSCPVSRWCHPTISSCHPLLLLLSIFPSSRVFSNESALHIRWPNYWSFSFSISPSNEYSGLIFFRMDWFHLLAVQGTLKSLLQHYSSKASIL